MSEFGFETKYEREQRIKHNTAIREANIAELRSQLVEAKAIANVLPQDMSYDSRSERIAVQEEIRKLNEMIADERKAISLEYSKGVEIG